MLEGIDIAGYAAITAICFLVGVAIKVSRIDDRYIPLVVGACGAGLGILAFLSGVPEFASNIIDGIARGVVSGLAATGIHQIYTQLGKSDEE